MALTISLGNKEDPYIYTKKLVDKGSLLNDEWVTQNIYTKKLVDKGSLMDEWLTITFIKVKHGSCLVAPVLSKW